MGSEAGVHVVVSVVSAVGAVLLLVVRTLVVG